MEAWLNTSAILVPNTISTGWCVNIPGAATILTVPQIIRHERPLHAVDPQQQRGDGAAQAAPAASHQPADHYRPSRLAELGLHLLYELHCTGW